MGSILPIPESTNDVVEAVITSAIAVHRVLGPGLLESAYEEALVLEFEHRGHAVRRQVDVAMEYRGHVLGASLRMDLLVDDVVVIEVKSVEALRPVHSAQLLTYLRFSGCRVGLLLNFNLPQLRQGIRRLAL